nr:MAG TPA: hypothetical protein [Inoviridae sp.]
MVYAYIVIHLKIQSQRYLEGKKQISPESLLGKN